MDAVEFFMYSKMFPDMNMFAAKHFKGGGLQLPISEVYHSYFSESPATTDYNLLVMQDLNHRGYKPIKPETCCLAFMRATITCLAQIHATAFAFKHEEGARAFARKYKVIEERKTPKLSTVKALMASRLLPFLTYLATIRPDLKHQLIMMVKFEKHLFKVFKGIHRTPNLSKLKIMIHGDSKIDNFLFKKVAYAIEEQYTAVLIDWQVSCKDVSVSQTNKNMEKWRPF